MPLPRSASQSLRRPLVYLRRGRRGLSILQQLGRDGLFRVENRVSLAKLDYAAADIYLQLDSKFAPMRIRSCAKEPWTVEWLERDVLAGEVVWDVGANVGAYSLVAAKAPRGAVTVVAVEPAFATYSSLCENIVLNEAESEIVPLNLTLASTTGLGQFNYRDLDAGAGLHSTGERPFLKGRFEPAYRQPVLTYRLDDLLAQFPLPAPNHMKLDVDGAELDVLRGAPATLSSRELRTLMIEMNEDEAEEMTQLLAAHGLHLEARHDPVSTHGHWYGLFARRAGAA